MHIITIANQKGGVGKTTTSIHLSAGLAMVGKKTLLIDLDPQKNTTSVFLEKSYEADPGIFHIFKDKLPLQKEICLNTRIENLKLIPSSSRLAEIDSMLAGKLDGFFSLRESIEKAEEKYQFIIIDCPPSLSMLTLNALVASSGIIIPLQVSKFSIDGIEGILKTCTEVKSRYNPKLKIIGAALTMHNPRTAISQAVVPEIEAHLKVLKTSIPVSVGVEECHMMQKTMFEYQKKNKVTASYKEFVNEVLALV